MNVLPFDENLRVEPRAGVYRTTMAEYLAINALSRTSLFELAKTPAHFDLARNMPRESTSAMEFGTAFHLAVLEPELARTSIRVAPTTVNSRRGMDWEHFASSTRDAGATPLTADERNHLLAMRKRLLAEPGIEVLLASPFRELTFVWCDPRTRVWCKARIDLFDDGPLKFMLDLKTTSDASERRFSYSAEDYGYTLQAGMYTAGADVLFGEAYCKGFIILAIEKEPPYRLEWYDMRRHVDPGREQFAALLDLYVACERANDWPAMQRLPGAPPIIRELPIVRRSNA